MKVIHFVKKYPALSQTFVDSYVEKSISFSSDVKLVSFKGVHDGEWLHKLPPKKFRRRNLRELPFYILDSLSHRKKWERSLLKFLNQNLDDETIIHTHFGDMGVLMVEFLLKHNIRSKNVTSFYGYDVSSLPLESKDYKQGLELLFEAGSAFLVEGPALGNKLGQLGCPDKKIYSNPLLVKCQGIPTKSYSKTAGVIKFLMVGRFVEKKGFHIALEALGQLRNELPDFSVTIIGYGEMEEIYRNIIAQYELGDSVDFLGAQEHGKVLEALAEHDFFLHPSLTAENGDSEGGAPTIIIEAQAARLPVIASDHADIPYVMGYNDFLAKESNIKSLKDSIIKAVKSDTLDDITEFGFNHVKNQHDYEQSKFYEKNLRDVLEL